MAPLDDHSSYRTYDEMTAPPRFFPRALLNARLNAGLDYWLELGRSGIPRRCDLSPPGMIRFLPHVLLWDYDPGRGRFVCRLAGTAACEAAGRELRGETLEAMHGEGSQMVRQNFLTVVETGQANFVRRRMSWVDRSYRHYERLLMPLADQAGELRHLIGILTVDYD